jgi:hypothetical protein
MMIRASPHGMCDECLQKALEEKNPRRRNPVERPWLHDESIYMVDAGLRTEWLEHLNSIRGFTPVSICEGHPRYPQVIGRVDILNGHPEAVMPYALSIKRHLLSLLPDTEVSVQFWALPGGGIVYDGRGRRRHFPKMPDLEALQDKYADYIDHTAFNITYMHSNTPANRARIALWWSKVPVAIKMVLR